VVRALHGDAQEHAGHGRGHRLRAPDGDDGQAQVRGHCDSGEALAPDALQPLSADMPTAYKYCLDRYDIAWVRINAVIDDMKASKFEHTERELDDADTALRNCKKVPNLFQNPPSLMEAVEGDLNATAVAKAIGSFLAK
jgi:hypothetical protein